MIVAFLILAVSVGAQGQGTAVFASPGASPGDPGYTADFCNSFQVSNPIVVESLGAFAAGGAQFLTGRNVGLFADVGNYPTTFLGAVTVPPTGNIVGCLA
jgi:hypothetical protein